MNNFPTRLTGKYELSRDAHLLTRTLNLELGRMLHHAVEDLVTIARNENVILDPTTIEISINRSPTSGTYDIKITAEGDEDINNA